MTASRSLQEVVAAAEAVRADAVDHDPWLAALRLVGIGWATVELERGANELLETLTDAGLPEPDWTAAARDTVLGATAWVTTGEPGRPAIVLLEPDTEGRLAATLARFGEGVAAVYLEATGGGAAEPARLGPSSAGPLGPSRIILSGRNWGPHLFVLEPSASGSTSKPSPRSRS